ncbi:hypothetical protein F5051DRAFT_446913 [Lentinula edodes]|nr:hypothetical protein F5051DRAFT_446913 [Lentinula edodes]
MAQVLADNWALREQDEDHSRLIAIDTRLGSMGAVSVTLGPLRVISERPRSLKRRRIVENSNEEDEEEKEKGEEEDGEGAEEGMVEEELAPTEARSEKGKERAE